MDTVLTNPGGTIVTVVDATANDSDKSWTTPAGKNRVILYVRVAYVATATVGNRTLRIEHWNATPSLIFACGPSALITANNNLAFISASDFSNLTLQGGSIHAICAYPSVGLHIPAGHMLRIRDEAAVDAAADDMTVSFAYVEYDI